MTNHGEISQAAHDCLTRLRQSAGLRYSGYREFGAVAVSEPALLRNFEQHGNPSDRVRQSNRLQDLRQIGRRLGDFVRSCEQIAFVGNSGTGKDHLMHAMCVGVALQGQPVEMHDAQVILTRAIDSPELGILDQLCRLSVLGLRDIARQWATRSLAALRLVIGRRYDQGRPTWWSTAEPFENVADWLGPEVVDRLMDRTTVIKCDWGTYRKRKEASGGQPAN